VFRTRVRWFFHAAEVKDMSDDIAAGAAAGAV
jgi:hypothetical protein